MRLFGKVDGAIDRFDRAEWLTGPFDLSWGAPVIILTPVERTWMIAAESRVASIAAYKRTWDIASDNRTWKIV